MLAKVAATLLDDREQRLLHAVSRVCRHDHRLPPLPRVTGAAGLLTEEARDIRYLDEQGRPVD